MLSSWTSSSKTNRQHFQKRRESIDEYNRKFKRFSKNLKALSTSLQKMQLARKHYEATQQKTIQALLQLEHADAPCAFRHEIISMAVPQDTTGTHIHQLSLQLERFEQNAKYRLDSLLQRASRTWYDVERHTKSLEHLQRLHSSNNNNTSLEQLSMTELQIQGTIDTLSERLQEYGMCDQELQEFDACVREGFYDVLKYYKLYLTNDITLAAELSQQQALVVFHIEQLAVQMKKDDPDPNNEADKGLPNIKVPSGTRDSSVTGSGETESISSCCCDEDESIVSSIDAIFPEIGAEEDEVAEDNVVKDEKAKNNLLKEEETEDSFLEVLEDEKTKNNLLKEEETGDCFLKEEETDNDLLIAEETESSFLKDEKTENNLMNEEMAEDNVVNDEKTENNLLKEEETGVCFLKEEETENNFLKEEVAEDNVVKDEKTENNLLKEEVAEDNVVKDEKTENNLLTEEVAEDNAVKDEKTENNLLKEEETEDCFLKDENTENILLKEEETGDSILKDEETEDSLLKEEETDYIFLKEEETEDITSNVMVKNNKEEEPMDNNNSNGMNDTNVAPHETKSRVGIDDKLSGPKVVNMDESGHTEESSSTSDNSDEEANDDDEDSVFSV